MVPIADLVLDPENRNLHPEEQLQELMNIIRFQGFREPVTVSLLSGVVKSGNARVIAAQRLGMTELPVIFQEFDDAAQEYAHGIATNAIAKWSKFDLTAIGKELPSLFPDLDMSFLGIKDFKIDLGEMPNLAPAEPAAPAEIVANDGIFKMILHYEKEQYEALTDDLADLMRLRALPNISLLFAQLVKESLERELPRDQAPT